MIQKITYTSILPYAKLPKEFKGKKVVGYYAGYNMKGGFNLLEASVAEVIYKQRIEGIIREALNLQGKAPNSSFSETSSYYKYSRDTYFLEEPDGTPTGSIISCLTTQHLSNLRIREHYLREGVTMPEDSKDLIAGTLQLQTFVSPKSLDVVKNLCDTLKALQSKGDGIIRIDSENVFVKPLYFDMDEVKSAIDNYLAFDPKK